MSTAILNGEIISGSTNYASAINYKKNNTTTSVQSELDKINNDLNGMRFGTDGDGNYGYYKADDSFIPFLKQVYIYVNSHYGATSSNGGTYNLIKYKLNNDLSLTQIGMQAYYGDNHIEGGLFVSYTYPTFSLQLKPGYSCLFNGSIQTATTSNLVLSSEHFSTNTASKMIITFE